jgi:hypothetical protein
MPIMSRSLFCRVAVETGARWIWRRGLDGVVPQKRIGQEYLAKRPADPALASLVKELLDQRVVERVELLHVKSTLFQPVFAIPKPDGTFRFLYDARALNKAVYVDKTKFEHLTVLASVAKKNDWAAKIDLKSAYHNMLIDEDYRRWLGFWYDRVPYRFRGLPFGLNAAPRLFTKFMRPVVQTLREMGIRVVIYLDDLLFLGETQEVCLKSLTLAMSLLQSLGFVINMKKSILTPTQKILFLGTIVDFTTMCFLIPAEKARAIREMAVKLLIQRKCTARELASTVGRLNATSHMCRPMRLHMAGLLKIMAQLHPARNGWEKSVTLTAQTQKELQWWSTLDPEAVAKPMCQAPPEFTITLETDASHYGWGGVLRQSKNPSLEARGFFARTEEEQSNNNRELRAVCLSVYSFVRDKQLAESISWKDKTILIRSDNRTSVAYINKMGGRVPSLTRLTANLWVWCLERGITLRAQYLPGEENSDADRLSRWENDKTDWQLNKEIFLQLENQWGPLSIDLFATRLNTQLPRFATWAFDPEATFRDAFQVDWSKERPYANPPFGLIGKVLQYLLETNAEMVLVAPVWPAQWWWPKLVSLASDLPIVLPDEEDLYTPPRPEAYKFLSTPRWASAAWMLSSDSGRCQAFRARLSACCETIGGPNQQLERMILLGRTGRSSLRQKDTAWTILHQLC